MWTQSSSPVQRPDMYKPLSDEVILAQQKSVYDRADQEAKKIGSTYNSLFGISTYGKDAEVLAQMQEQFKQQVGELSKQGLASPEVNSRINQLITQYSSSPDVLAIHQRKAFYDSENEEKQKAEEKGLPFFSKDFKKLGEYYSGDKYYRKPENFSLSKGFIGVNLAKDRAAALKDVPTEQYIGADGRYHKRFNQNALDESLNAFYVDPRVKKQLLYDIEESWEGRDFEVEGTQQLNSFKQEASDNYEKAMALGRTDLASCFQQDVDRYDLMLQDPKGYSENIKNTIYNKELRKRIATDKEHANFDSVEKADEYKMKAIDLQNNLLEKQYDYLLPGLAFYGVPSTNLSQTFRDLAAGKIKDALGNVVTLQDIGAKSEEHAQKQTLEGKIQQAVALEDAKKKVAEVFSNEDAVQFALDNPGYDTKLKMTPGYLDKYTSGMSHIKNNIDKILPYIKDISKNGKTYYVKDLVAKMITEGFNSQSIVDKGDYYQIDKPYSLNDWQIPKEAFQQAVADYMAKKREDAIKDASTSNTPSATITPQPVIKNPSYPTVGEEVNTDSLISNKLYNTPKGLRKWDGTNFVAAQ
jgi:hypothetical protein